MLKLADIFGFGITEKPAAFRRLCVETTLNIPTDLVKRPAAFRRLCVETAVHTLYAPNSKPAAFRRLCVETTPLDSSQGNALASRLQAAVC